MTEKNGEWRATQAERWGFLKAKLEDQDNNIKDIKEDIKDNNKQMQTSISEIKDIVRGYNDDSAKYRQKIEKRITSVEIKSGLYGTIAGFIGGLTSGFIGLFGINR